MNPWYLLAVVVAVIAVMMNWTPYSNVDRIEPFSISRRDPIIIHIDKDIIMCGGWTLSNHSGVIVSSLCDRYNTIQGKWTPMAPMPGPRYRGVAMASEDGFFIVGGDDDAHHHLAPTTYRYHESFNSWSIVSVLTGNAALLRRSFGGFIDKGHIYVFGGDDGPSRSDYHVLTSCFKVNINTGDVTPLASMPEPRTEFESSFQ